jgi:hypothetical protein
MKRLDINLNLGQMTGATTTWITFARQGGRKVGSRAQVLKWVRGSFVQMGEEVLEV